MTQYSKLRDLIQLTAQYERASNAKLNRSEALAVSLSGELQLSWE